MSHYKHILVGLDLSEDCRYVLERAKQICAGNDTKISVVHVVEPLTFAYGGDIPIDLTEVQTQLEEKAQQHLSQAVEPFELQAQQLHIVVGQPDVEIHDLASDIDVDLIIVGSHGRKGLALLLGSTSNGVLHGANCDVLAVRLPK